MVGSPCHDHHPSARCGAPPSRGRSAGREPARCGRGGVRYLVQNNRWGTEATQCVSARDGGFSLERADGSVVAAGPPKSYPSVVAGCHWGRCSTTPGLPVRADRVGAARTTVSIDRAPGRWNAAYDVWFDSRPDPDGQNDTAELMIWIDRGGDPAPVGSPRGQLGFEPWVGGAGLTARDFSLTPDVAADGVVVGAASGRCLDVARASTSRGARVQQWTCPDGGPGQQWRSRADNSVVDPASGLCLDAAGRGAGNGTPLQTWTCRSGQGNQTWR